jgi:phosphoribosylglycinamide formyltransferase-1
MKNEQAGSMLRIAVFGSGRGSNFGAIVKAIRTGMIPRTQIVVVISNNADAGILELARQEDIPALHLSSRQFPDENAFVEALLRTLRGKDVNFIVLAGYMKRLHPRVISAFRNRIINIHPALLPKFGGRGMFGEHVHRAVLAGGEKESGATVHVVDEEYDHGPVVLQRTVPVLPRDTVETLAARVLKVEHELYPEAIRLFAEGKVVTEDRDVVVQHH